MDCWILAGQSNMEGYGILNDPRGRQISSPLVTSLSSSGVWEVAAQPLHRLWESYTPVDQDLDRTRIKQSESLLSNAELAKRARAENAHGHGLGISFGLEMAKATDKEIGLIPSAHGGTSLSDWSPERIHLGVMSFFGAMLDRARRAQRAGGVIRGILWYQGESDANVEQDAHTYEDRFIEWISAARSALHEPELPVHVVQLGRLAIPRNAPEGWSERGWNTVRESQRRLPAQVPHTAVISSIDLTLTDRIHLDSPSLDRLGKRLAQAALSEGRTPNVERVAQAPAAANGLIRIRVECNDVSEAWREDVRLQGFCVCGPDGNEHPDMKVVAARVATDSRSSIDLLVDALAGVDTRAKVAYGQGWDPACSVVDAADASLPAFAPQTVTWNSAEIA